MFEKGLRFELKNGDGEIIYYVDEFGAVEFYLWIDYLTFEDDKDMRIKKISGLEWEAFLFYEGFTELPDLPDLEYTLEEEKTEKPEGVSYYLSKSILKNCIIDNEKGKKKVLELLKGVPFSFLKGDEEGWIKKFVNVLVEEGRVTDKRTYYTLYPGNDLEVEVDPEGIMVMKNMLIKSGSKTKLIMKKIIDEENPQKAKKLIELFERVLAKRVDLQDVVSEALKSLGLVKT